MVNDRAVRFQNRAPVQKSTSQRDAYLKALTDYGNTSRPPRWYEQTYGQPGNNVQNKAAKAALGTFLGALDVPVQAIGGMHRDALAGNTLGEQSPGSRALQNYGQQVGGLWSDVFKPGQGQTPLFQPREFEAAGEAAVDRFGLEGGAALAARGGATALDLLTGLVAGGVGGVGRGTVRAAGDAVSTTASRLRPAFQKDDVYLQAFFRQMMANPDTRISTVRSMNSMDDIIGNTGNFRSSRTTGTSGANSGEKSASDYNRLREAFENRVDGNEKDFVYGAITSPVLRDIPAPFPLFARGRENFLNYMKMAQNTDPYDTAISYGRSGGTNPRIPMRYEWGPEATANASLAWGDSLRGAPFFKNVDDFKAAINKGIIEGVENAPGRADWGWGTTKNSSISIPDYIEAQIPKLTIDDISRITALGKRPGDAAAQGINIIDALTAAGKDIPVSVQSFNVPRNVYQSEFKRTGVLDELYDNPAYANILDEILDQRSNFLSPNLANKIAPYSKNNALIQSRHYDSSGAYHSPNWSVGHSLNRQGIDNNRPSSAVAQGLKDFYAQQISPQLQAFQRALFPEVRVPANRTGRTRPAFD